MRESHAKDRSLQRLRWYRHVLATLGLLGSLLVLEAGFIEDRAHRSVSLLQVWGRPALLLATFFACAYGDVFIKCIIRLFRSAPSHRQRETQGNHMK